MTATSSLPQSPGGSSVSFVDGAARDLDELYASLHLHYGADAADGLLDRLEVALSPAAGFPDNGRTPPELAALGAFEYRQLWLAPYRVVFKALGSEVHVLAIVDSRRGLDSSLMRRLLEA